MTAGRRGDIVLGVVVGLTAEARIARALGLVEAGGGLPDGAAAAAERLVARGATALLSFGLAGGLDPRLAPGHIVMPRMVLEDGVLEDGVLEDGHRHAADAALLRRFGGPNATLMLAGSRVLADVAAKRAAFAATGAVAVDLESGAVARVAARHGLPFAVLRAICDPAGRTLPPAALAALDAGGSIGLLRVLGSLAGEPRQLPALIRLGRDAARARRALVLRAKAMSGAVKRERPV